MHGRKLLVVGVAAFLACSRSDKENTLVAQGSQSPGAAATQALENEADRSTSMRVREALSNDPTLAASAERIQVETVNGIVMLRGSVVSEAERQTALQSARRIVGQNSVEDRLEIAGPTEDQDRD